MYLIRNVQIITFKRFIGGVKYFTLQNKNIFGLSIFKCYKVIESGTWDHINQGTIEHYEALEWSRKGSPQCGLEWLRISHEQMLKLINWKSSA